MPERDTTRFLELMNKANEAIAAREAEEEKYEAPQPDAVRLQRDAERRERLGQLRAREHRSKRPREVRNVFGKVDLSKE